MYKVPDVPSPRIFTIRPYVPGDEEQVYIVCTKTCKDGLEDPSPLVPELKNIHADRIVGPYLTLHPEFCFVVEVKVIPPVCFPTNCSNRNDVLGRNWCGWIRLCSA